MGKTRSSTKPDGLLVPTELPLLALEAQVLLPTAYARISVSAKSDRSMALISHLLQQRGRNVLIAVVPLLPADASAHKALPGKAADRKHSRGQHGSHSDAKQRDDVDLGRLHTLGTAARVLQLTRSAQSGNWVLVLEGCCRLRVDATSGEREYYSATLQQLELFPASDPRHEGEELGEEAAETLAQLRRAARQLLGMVSLTTGAAAAARLADVLESSPPGKCADLLAAVLTPPPAARMAVLDAADIGARLQIVLALVKDALKAAGQVVGALGDSATVLSGAGGDDRVSAAARIAALRRLQAAQKGLPGGSFFSGGRPRRRSGSGDGGEEEDELAELAQRIENAAMPPDVHKMAMRELKRLQRSSEQHPGHAISRTYLETLADLPWNAFAARPAAFAAAQAAAPQAAAATRAEAQPSQPEPAAESDAQQPDADGAVGGTGPSDGAEAVSAAAPEHKELSLAEARALLDEHHHGLDKVKTRIVQYLAVRRLRGPEARAPILAFVGPPGVGKTSLARSVAAALGRPLMRISLGGVRDEAEVRGHRRTYIGAMPGRVIQAVKRAGVRDGLLLLDEVDKMGRDARGDPAAALLEVLDPEQNAAFVDTYLGVPFDLSKVVFLATGNQLSAIPAPLLDRLEVIHLSGYTLDEKVHIADKHLIPSLLEEHGLTPQQLRFPPSALETVACSYTREAGVRSLSRALASICRHVAVNVVEAADGAAGGGAAPQPPAAEAGPAENYEMPQQHALPRAEARGFAHAVSRGQCSAAGPAPTAAGSTGGGRGVRMQVDTASQLLTTSAHGSAFAGVTEQVVVDDALIEEVLGPRHFGENDAAQRIAGAGSAAGLVWTEAGGQVQYVECIATGRGAAGRPGSLTLTGQMGEVLEESARIALSWIRAHAGQLPLLPADACGEPHPSEAALGAGDGPGAGAEVMRAAGAPSAPGAAGPTCWDVHVHLPAGAVPKDGPSAGVTLATALASLYTGRPARADTAMTGELTLRGLVLPVGGVKDKLLAAHQAGMTRVIIPARNVRDVKADLPAAVRDALEIIPAERLEQVLANAFDPPLVLQPWAKL